MNEQQRLYLVQARSDWKVLHLLEKEAVCHRLLYLQMCSEKLAKAYFWRTPIAATMGHAALREFLRAISNNRRVEKGLGFANRASFQQWTRDISPLAEQIEKLAPALAGDGPNPEYPWPRHHPTQAPIEYRFELWDEMQKSRGKKLRKMLEQFLLHFEEWV